MTDINSLAREVVQECPVPITVVEAIQFIRPIQQNFQIEDQVLVKKSADAIQKQYEDGVIDNDGVILEYEGSVIALDETSQRIE